MSRIVDISLRIDASMLVWPGDPPVSVTRTSSIEGGDEANVSELRCGTHTGTHVDPPLHFLDGGAPAHALPLDVLVGPAVVADLRHVATQITVANLDALDLAPDVTRLLLRTRNSDLWRAPSPTFPDTYVALSVDAATWIVDRGIRLVGTDFLSIEARGAAGHPVHHTLLRAGVVIVEGLDLGDATPGATTLVCLPLKISDGDGAPARAILLEPDQR
jgi:arylformamidase